MVLYLCPKLKDSDILKRSCIANAISEKVEKLDIIDIDLIAVRPLHIFLFHLMSSSIEDSRSYFCHLGWVVNEAPLSIFLYEHPVYSCLNQCSV